jgi:hypothetical protein
VDYRATATFERVNVKGQREYWEKNLGQGFEKETDINGVTITHYFFTSGVLAGRLRRTSEESGATKKTTYQASYDQSGQKLREFLEDGSTIEYKEGGNTVIESSPKGTSTIEKFQNATTRVTTRTPQGEVRVLSLDAAGRVRLQNP